MAPMEVKLRVGSNEPFVLEVDDEETVEALAVLVISLKPELGEQDLPRLVHKGRVLKHEQVVKDLGIQSSEFVVVVPAKAGHATSEFG
ncbi:unnamed protein product [Effrenium voratum]|nr:unnamed protein product [Effrenium voratum]